jgi:SecD/SecF fusion protein
MKTTTLLLNFLFAFTLMAVEAPKPAVLEVRLVLDSASADSELLPWTHQGRSPGQSVTEQLHVQKKPLVDGSALRSALVPKEPVTGASEILITLTEAGTQRFAEVTRDRVGQRLAFVIDGKIYSAPTIRTEIRGGKALITGFTPQQATDLASRLNQGVQTP